MLVDKAFTDFALSKSGESESHWQNLINSDLEDQLVKLKHPVDLHVPTKMEEEAAELDVLEDIAKSTRNTNSELTPSLMRQAKRQHDTVTL